MPNTEDNKDTVWWVKSIYGARTRLPLVQISVPPMEKDEAPIIKLLSPEEARDLASNLLQSAEAAECDTFLVEWSQKVVGLDDKSASRLMNEYRVFRAAKREG